ncbi:MAG TPA: mechanosensitive ion channel domain-containing protein [Myxococcaceae bacterium]|nr:mechanosensitive ion channel domain-containing protein [Myxococcaceae bacterium]
MNRTLVRAAASSPRRCPRPVISEGAKRASFAALVLASVVLATPFLAAEAGEAPPQTPTAPANAQASPAVPTLYDVVGELARTDDLRRDIAATLRDTSDWKALTTQLEPSPLAPHFEAVIASSDPVTRLRYVELRALDVSLRERLRAVSGSASALGRMLQRVVADLERLDQTAALWPQRATVARDGRAPLEVQRSIDSVGPGLASLREQLVARRDGLLVAYEHAVRLQVRLESMRSDVADRRDHLFGMLRTSVAAPVWRSGTGVHPVDELRANWQLARTELTEYLSDSGEVVDALFVVLATLLLVLLRRPAALRAHQPTTPPVSWGTAVCGALAVALASLAVFAKLAPSSAPLAFHRLIWFSFPLLAAAVAARTFASSIRATAWALAFAVFLNGFREFVEMSPVLDWLLLGVQVVPFGIAVVRDWRRGALAEFFPSWPPALLGWLVRTLALGLGVAIVARLQGYVGVAGVLVAVLVIAPGYVLTFAGTVWTVDRAMAGLLGTRLAQMFRSAREQPDAIMRTVHWISVLVAWAVGGAAFALSYSALDDLNRLGRSIVKMSLTVGDVRITLEAIVAALVVVALTWLLTKLVRFILEEELLPRLNLRSGVPVAVSTIVGYVLVVTGWVLAMAALGIDLSKVTLLAGAVGVGIGFGFQNVVNNFASGLILIIERPIKVGDQIDVGDVVGEVERIGVRSSTIRTAQGAEVIVPNSDLVGKQVTNWTLFDRSRRYEIDVSVAHGTEAAKILRLLEATAASVPEVLKKPAPQALFTGFDEKRLDFRLLVWVESIEVGLQAQNNLRLAILRDLSEPSAPLAVSVGTSRQWRQEASSGLASGGGGDVDPRCLGTPRHGMPGASQGRAREGGNVE